MLSIDRYILGKLMLSALIEAINKYKGILL